MTTITFDKFKYVERLKLAGFSEEQAKAEVEALALALEQTIAVRDLATKLDISALRVDMEAMKVDLIKWMAGLLLAQAAIVAALVKLL